MATQIICKLRCLEIRCRYNLWMVQKARKVGYFWSPTRMDNALRHVGAYICREPASPLPWISSTKMAGEIQFETQKTQQFILVAAIAHVICVSNCQSFILLSYPLTNFPYWFPSKMEYQWIYGVPSQVKQWNFNAVKLYCGGRFFVDRHFTVG